MDLVQIKHYLRAHRVVPLPDIALHFKVEMATIRPLLEVWVKKGKVRRNVGAAGTCKGCCKCDPATLESYEWLG